MEDRAALRGKEGFWRFQTIMENDEALPPPPYLVNDVYMSFIGARFDRHAVRELLPPELEPVDSHTGTICVYSVGAGWGVAPFSACFAAVEVEGYRAPDGSPGYYLATGYYSGGGYRMMNRHYNLHALKGGSRHYYDGDLAVGIGGPEGHEVLKIKTKPGAITHPSFAARYYMGKGPWGGTSQFAIAASGLIYEAEPISVEITEDADERMKLARPVEMIYGAHCVDLSLTFGRPRAAGDIGGDVAARASLLSAFSQIGRAAILVGTSGEVMAINAMAEPLLGDTVQIERGRLVAARHADRAALTQAIASVAEGQPGLSIEPIGLEQRHGSPLIVQVMAVGDAPTGTPSALVLLNDPASAPTSSPAPALQLLGLTPAEARIAELVGSGLSPREAAEKLENSEGTVRTSLNRIYQKLDINRQSELARIVARL